MINIVGHLELYRNRGYFINLYNECDVPDREFIIFTFSLLFILLEVEGYIIHIGVIFILSITKSVNTCETSLNISLDELNVANFTLCL